MSARSSDVHLCLKLLALPMLRKLLLSTPCRAPWQACTARPQFPR